MRHLCWLPTILSVVRLASDAAVPEWAQQPGELFSLTRTPSELSLVCASQHVPPGIRAERDWCAFAVQGPLDFALTGILHSLTRPLAEAGISLFALSTFDTDYILVRMSDQARTQDALQAAGHRWV